MSNATRCVILFSGGTDSLCTAALKAKVFDEIHLLTFFEWNTRNSNNPKKNVEKLRSRFPSVSWVHRRVCVDTLVVRFSYDNYIRSLFRFHFLNLATPGFSSLSWHTASLLYCIYQDIPNVFDGQTQELLQYPGHMESTIQLYKNLYRKYGILYENPVREWEVPKDQQFLDRLLVDQHGFSFSLQESSLKKTTGAYVYQQGLAPKINIKGSVLDHGMQANCFSFVVYNVLFFWIFMNLTTYEKFCTKVCSLLREKLARIQPEIDLFSQTKSKKTLIDLGLEGLFRSENP